jgi:hypothetical protein
MNMNAEGREQSSARRTTNTAVSFHDALFEIAPKENQKTQDFISSLVMLPEPQVLGILEALLAETPERLDALLYDTLSATCRDSPHFPRKMYTNFEHEPWTPV